MQAFREYRQGVPTNPRSTEPAMARHTISSALQLKTMLAQAQKEAAERKTRVRVSDGDGLRLEVTPTGAASWQLVYSMPGKSKNTFTIGAHPPVTLATARIVADQVRNKIAMGIDPNAEKREARKGGASTVTGDLVTTVGQDYIKDCERRQLSKVYLRDLTRAFEVDLYPHLGDKVAKAVTTEDIERLLHRLEARGALVYLRRFTGWVRRMFDNAKIRPNPCADVDLESFKKPVSKGGRPGVTSPKLLAQVLRGIDGFEGSAISRAALLIHARTFVRPTELQFADWSQVGARHLTISVVLAEGTYEHLVPLAPQTLELFEGLRPLHPRFVLPGTRYGQRISEATLNAVLHSLGWKGVHCTHGFRKSASTLLREMGWETEWVERQLSHQLTNAVERAYNKALYLPQRERMMQCWSDYIDALLDPASGADQMLPHEWRDQWGAATSSRASSSASLPR